MSITPSGCRGVASRTYVEQRPASSTSNTKKSSASPPATAADGTTETVRSAKVSRQHGDKLTKKQIRQCAIAKARAKAARVRVARLHARAGARNNLRRRNNESGSLTGRDRLQQELGRPFRLSDHLPVLGEDGSEGEEMGAGRTRPCGAQVPGCRARPVATHATAARVGRRTAPTRSSSTTGARHLALINGRSSSCSRWPAATAPVMGLHQDGARRPQAADPPVPSLLRGRGALPDQEGVGPGQELTQVHDLGRGRLAAIVVISGFGQTRLGSGRTWDTFV